MDDFLCELQIEDVTNEEEIEAIADWALEAASDGLTPNIKMGFSQKEING